MPKFGRHSGTICLLLVTASGCGPRIDQAELGEISKTLPALPGTDEPYPLPELDVPSAVDAAAAKEAESPPARPENETPPSEAP